MAKPLIDADHFKAGVLQTRARLEANPEGGMIRPSVEGRLVGGVSVETRWEQFGQQFRAAFGRTGRARRPGERADGHPVLPDRHRLLPRRLVRQGAALAGCELEGLSLRLEALLDMRRECDLPATGATEHLLAEADVESPSSDEAVLAMANEAFQRCPLWNLVGRGVPVHRRVRHQGRLILDTVP